MTGTPRWSLAMSDLLQKAPTMTPLHTYHTTDKSTWGPGPWQSEPDKVQWKDETTGLPCLIVRGPSGALCGYAGVEKKHPAFGRGYDDGWSVWTQDENDELVERPPIYPSLAEVSVHGGLTFSGPCQEYAEAKGVCHIPEPGEPDNIWWFGFDCAHSGDLTPGSDARMAEIGVPRFDFAAFGYIYRDLAYVQAEVERLAQALALADV